MLSNGEIYNLALKLQAEFMKRHIEVSMVELRDFLKDLNRQNVQKPAMEEQARVWGEGKIKPQATVSTVQNRPVIAKPVEAKPAETKPAIPEPVVTKPVETKPVAPKPAETKPAESKPVTPTPAETKPATPKPAEVKPVEAKPVETKAAAPKPAEAKPATPKPVETRPTPPRSAEARTTALKSATSKPAEAKPATPKPAEATPAVQKAAAIEPVKMDTVQEKPFSEPGSGRLFFEWVKGPFRSGFYRSYVESLGLKGNERVLEYGSGTGAASRHIAPILQKKTGHLTCVDISTVFMNSVKKKMSKYPNVDFMLGDIRILDIKSGSYDMVFMHYVLHDIPEGRRQENVGMLASKLKNGGRICIREPTGEKHGMPAEEIKRIMTYAGLKEVSSGTGKRTFGGPMFYGVFKK